MTEQGLGYVDPIIREISNFFEICVTNLEPPVATVLSNLAHYTTHTATKRLKEVVKKEKVSAFQVDRILNMTLTLMKRNPKPRSTASYIVCVTTIKIIVSS